jgi:DNA processing protein
VDEADAVAWLALSLAEGVGPRTAEVLVRGLGSAAAVVRAAAADLAPLVGAARARTLTAALRAAGPERVLRDARGLDQVVTTPADPAWPEAAFAGLPDPPLALYVRGPAPLARSPSAAVVGSRAAGGYGRRVAEALGEGLARAGVRVVSGLAAGIDEAAHRGALAAGPRGAGTVAVLGRGLDVTYPPEHGDLQEAIAASGLLVSEHPPGTPPHPGHFPRRNRLVAALSDVVVVAEARARSGALLTAGRALELGREVMAVPGPVTRDEHRGCHRLLKRGEAALCEGVFDVLALLGIETRGGEDPLGAPGAAPAEPPPGLPRAVYAVIGDDEVVDADEICRRTALAPSDVAVALTRLELEGLLARVPGVGVRRV